MTNLTLDARIYVAGHAGLVGSAIMRRLAAEGFRHALTATREQLLDVTRLHALGWRHRIELEEGTAQSYRWFLDHLSTARGNTRS